MLLYEINRFACYVGWIPRSDEKFQAQVAEVSVADVFPLAYFCYSYSYADVLSILYPKRRSCYGILRSETRPVEDAEFGVHLPCSSWLHRRLKVEPAKQNPGLPVC